MKKLVLMAVAGALAGLLVLPPVSSAAQPKFGLKAGLNVANLTGADVATIEAESSPTKSKVGFCAGGFVVFDLAKSMAIQVEALYTQKGADMNMATDVGTVAFHWNEDYLEIPVLFKYTFETKGRVKPNLFAGPSVAFKLSAKLKAEFQGESAEQTIPGFKSTDFGLVFGGGIDIGPKIRLDARYIMGLTKLIEFEGVTSDIKNGVFSVMIGYSFK